ncbi:unnamed protein product [Effrenium voratum]|uniref:Polynucleotide adenylyltransferase n=1 Tax=Effrenium voratum TaxID=2562239 RepID=A0AA36I9A2_9DINO|nr:unnamed protein product [Effrenium voratum]
MLQPAQAAGVDSNLLKQLQARMTSLQLFAGKLELNASDTAEAGAIVHSLEGHAGGWVNMDALQPVAGHGPPGLGAPAASAAPIASNGGIFEDFETVFDEPSANLRAAKSRSKKKDATREDTFSNRSTSKAPSVISVPESDPLQEDPLFTNDPWSAGPVGSSRSTGNAGAKKRPSPNNLSFNNSSLLASAISALPPGRIEVRHEAKSQAFRASNDPWASSDPWGGRSNGDARTSKTSQDPWASSDPWSQPGGAGRKSDARPDMYKYQAPRDSREDPWTSADPWGGKSGSQPESDPLAVHDPWSAGKVSDPLAVHDPWAKGESSRETQPRQPLQESRRPEVLQQEVDSPGPKVRQAYQSGRGGEKPALHQRSIDMLNEFIWRTHSGERSAEEQKLVVYDILRRVEAAVKKSGLSGAVAPFGSYATGFKGSTSDVDLAYTGEVGDGGQAAQVSALAGVVRHLSAAGFQDITKVFSSSIPLIKFFDPDSGLEVDFLIRNELGIRNSLLLDTYCQCDPRVSVLGKLVKDWAKRHELVGSPDGCLNSYAYMLMTIHFLQHLHPQVIPNLQALPSESHQVKDWKWGNVPNVWETKFFKEVVELQPSDNRMSIAELLFGFLHFFGREFNWSKHAVCIRLNSPGAVVEKSQLCKTADPEQWYIEDPFDLKHNLAGRCSAAGRRRILSAMHKATTKLYSAKLVEVCGPPALEGYFLKCKVTAAIEAEELLKPFEGTDLRRLHMPVLQNARTGQAFLEFATAPGRRRAHSRNESYVQDLQLSLIQSSKFALDEAMEESSRTRSTTCFKRQSRRCRWMCRRCRRSTGNEAPQGAVPAQFESIRSPCFI